MTNTPPRKKPRTATPRPQTIANLNAEARRINAAIQKEANAEKARQAKRVATLAKRQAAVQKRREKIGTMVRKTYLKNNQIAALVTRHLEPKNAKAAAIAFGSTAFARAGRNKQEALRAKVQKYQLQWRIWFTGMTPNQRKNLARNVYSALYPNNNNNEAKNVEVYPVLFGSRGLALPVPKNTTKLTSKELARRRPNWPNWPNAPINPTNFNAESKKLNRQRRTHANRWTGAYRALYELSRPEVNRVLRQHGLPFSMAQARRNLLTTVGNTEQRVNSWLTRSRGNTRPWGNLSGTRNIGPRRPQLSFGAHV